MNNNIIYLTYEYNNNILDMSIEQSKNFNNNK